MDISKKSASNRRRSSANSEKKGTGGTSSMMTSQEAAAAQSLQLLLREDTLLKEYGLTESSGSTATASSSSSSSSDNNNKSQQQKSVDQVAFPYAAALLHSSNTNDDGTNATGVGIDTDLDASERSSAKQRADMALQDVERKLALVESLAVKLSRTRPEAVAGHLLRLHGYQLSDDDGDTNDEKKDSSNETAVDSGDDDPSLSSAAAAATDNNATTTSASVLTLATIRDRADRLERQANVLDSVAQRVESSLTRGHDRMSVACLRLQRVLTLSSTLKSILRIQFESNKLLNYDLDDTRDLSRAAASVAILEELLTPDLYGIVVVDEMRPRVEQTAKQVRQAAAALLEGVIIDQQGQDGGEGEGETRQQSLSLPQLGATLQVYYHLHELPTAVWKAVELAHSKAEAVSKELFNPVTLQNLTDQARRTAKESRLIPKKLRQIRVETAYKWSNDFVRIALHVRNLQLVLNRKTDPVSRQSFVEVVNNAPVPNEFVLIKDSSSSSNNKQQAMSIFAHFWERCCGTISSLLNQILAQDNGKYREDVAALYPAVRAAAMDMMSRIQETNPNAGSGGGGGGTTSSLLEDYGNTGGSRSGGILGGSSLLDDNFLEWNTTTDGTLASDNPQAAASNTTSPADVWTRVGGGGMDVSMTSSSRFLMGGGGMSGGIPVSAIFQLYEWKALQGNAQTKSGLYPLQQAFLRSCTERLCAPLQYMFPENITLDENGVPLSSAGMALLPSKYDVQRFDENIRQELSLADPRADGGGGGGASGTGGIGGDYTLITMIAECVVDMVHQFCESAKKAISGVPNPEYDGYVRDSDDWTMTESLHHDRKVVAIMYAVAKNIKNAPDKTFIMPYKPAINISSQNEEAATMCSYALQPALHDIDNTVRSIILNPLCRAINRRIITNVMSKMHHGVYIDTSSGGGNFDDSPAFVQKYLSGAFELISQNLLARFPPEYAAALTSKIASFSIYAFVSNASLLRPLSENARLHITQDLADLELALEQLVLKSGHGNATHLNQIDNGKPYAELRAVRQMLFWTGLENTSMSAQEVSKALLREVWMKDVRPSTVFHYLFSFAPSLLSSPHHFKRMRAEEYVSTVLVKLDGSDIEDGEDAAWITTMSCCDSYQQRASSMASSSSNVDGDSRIPQTLMLLGQELMRRRRSNH